MTAVGRAIRDFGFAGIAASLLALVILFGIFFVSDAPQQIAIKDKEIARLEKRIAQLSPPPLVDPCDKISIPHNGDERTATLDVIDKLLASITRGKTFAAITAAEQISIEFQSPMVAGRDASAVMQQIDSLIQLAKEADDDRLKISFAVSGQPIDRCVRGEGHPGSGERDTTIPRLTARYIKTLPSEAFTNAAAWSLVRYAPNVAQLLQWISDYATWTNNLRQTLVTKRNQSEVR